MVAWPLLPVLVEELDIPALAYLLLVALPFLLLPEELLDLSASSLLILELDALPSLAGCRVQVVIVVGHRAVN